MKKLPLILGLLCCLWAVSAGAETYLFPYEGLRFEGQDNLRLVTQHNILEHETYLRKNGWSGEDLLAEMRQKQAVFVAFPASGAPVWLSLAPSDAQPGLPDSVAFMNETQRERFRKGYADAALYQDAVWNTNHPNWLQTTFSTRNRSGEAVYTLRLVTRALGQLYLLDRAYVPEGQEGLPGEEDLLVMERVLSRLSLLDTLPETAAPNAPPPSATPLPTAEPERTDATLHQRQQGIEVSLSPFPQEMESPTLELDGETVAGASVQLWSGETRLARTSAERDGSFRISADFPQGGQITLRLTASAPDQPETELVFTVSYTPGPLPLAVTGPLETVYANTAQLTGQTLPGASIELRGGNVLSNLKANAQGEFSFKLTTDKAGETEYTLTAKKEGYLETKVSHTVRRVLTEQEEYADFRFHMSEVPYDRLVKDPAAQEGKLVSFRGRVMAIEELDGFPCLLLYTKNPAKGQWTEPVWVACDEIFDVALEDMLTVYVAITGETRPMPQSAKEDETAPLVRLSYWSK